MSSWIIFLLLQSLLINAEGQGPGGRNFGGAGRLEFEVSEELPTGSYVGKIPTRPKFTYRFNDNVEEFVLHPTTGEIHTGKIIDRESLQSDTFDLVILSSHPTYPVEVRIKILDTNDHSPSFPDPIVRVTFSESSTPGTRVFLDTAEDSDTGSNSVSDNYRIVDGNEAGHFRLSVNTNPSGDSSFLFLETTGVLDRETNSEYLLNISASDDGKPPRLGFVTVEVSILDTNDNPPIFDHSDYVVSLNETVPMGTPVLQVTATDNDEGENSKVTYYLAETETQFIVDPETGIISTLTPSLSCQQTCLQGVQKMCSKSCVFTVFARDHGIPRQDGRTYVTVNLLDANDHDPVIKFRYFPDTASTATVDENALNGSVVAAISVFDPDEGLNGETEVEILSGNELNHFRLESTPSFQLLRVNGILDRERIWKYNLSLIATDKGSPPRSSSSFLLVQVNDINDHEPIFQQTEYSAVLRELTPIGSFVASITAHDEDTGINSQVFYSIVSGNEAGWFAIDHDSGLLTTKSELDREKHDTVRLRISARDGGPNPKWAFSEIKITITDENDEPPRFESQKIILHVAEDSSIGTLLTTLSAVDHDQGTNGSISYYLDAGAEESYPGVFQLDPSTGALVNKLKFDREVIPAYDFLVIAKDKGSPSLSSSATINLHITDVNDNDPVVYPVQYYITLDPDTPKNTELLRVKATDADEKNVLNFQFLKESEIFSINPQNGVVSLKKSLSTSREEIFILKVQVTDQGGRKSASDAEITIQRTQQNQIKSSIPSITFNVTEDSNLDKGFREHRKIGQVKIEKLKSSGSLSYKILDGDPDTVFRIDDTGVLYSINPIDREVKADYALLILIQSKSTSAATTSMSPSSLLSSAQFVNVIIHVSDLNDNAPVFQFMRPEVVISESGAIGSDIFHVSVIDRDYGPNSSLSFSLLSNPNDIFGINARNGLVTLRKSLIDSPAIQPMDSDTYVGTLEFEILVKDNNGQAPFLSSRQVVKVKILDDNNHTPVFGSTAYETSILESTPVNAKIFKIEATDGDVGKNGEIFYTVQDSHGSEKFGIFPDGSVYLKNSVDREKEDFYLLSIVSSDRGEPARYTTTTLAIHVLDENDNPPVFSNSTFTFTISENEDPDTFVGKLSASDGDVGRNAELNYSILGNSKDFIIDPRNGIIRSIRSFDREKLLESTGHDFLTLDVIVVDGGNNRLNDTAQVRIYIEDENDNRPIFTKSLYTASISEGTPVGSHVVRVHATDADHGLNGDVFYSFQNPEEFFRIDGTTGQITNTKLLDRESVSSYTLKVVASDMSPDGRLNSSSTVIVEILDENDNAPEFAHSEPFISISETVGIGKELMQFQATDPDGPGMNSLVSLSITGGNKGDVFRLDPKTGALYLNKALDFEKSSSYTLNISASDHGMPKLSSSLQFLVKIEDYNDNPPSFPSTAIFRRITEGLPINSSIVTVSADDPDSGLNGKIIYSITDQEPAGDYFGIDSEEGRIYTLREIDRETTESFRLIVTATDQAIPTSARLSSEKLVTIIVEDINDNEPRYTSMSAAILNKGDKGGTEISKIQAVDRDSEANGVVTYEITSGDTSLFSLNRNTGSLTLRRPVNEPQPRYQLTIRASDEAIKTQRKYSELYLTVIGLDRNQSSACSAKGLTFSSSSYKVSIYENEPISTSVLRVNVGLKSEVEYYITNITSVATGAMVDRVFEIDVRRGIISTVLPVDREAGVERFQLEVYAILISSSGLCTASTKVEIEILDRNDSPPKFKNRKMHLNVSESSPMDYEILTLTATDEDTVGNVTYSIVKGGRGKFNIGKNTGILSIADALDREESEEYQLIVQASDGIQDSTMKIFIKVLDENDNPPTFTDHGIYSFDIPEDAPLYTSVGEVKAVDPDKGVNGVVTYSVLSDWGNDVFALNPETGVFTLTSRLDYENVQHYVFVIEAQDRGVPSLSSTATVYMNVVDLNDNSPTFDPMNTGREVYENISLGTSVITLSATDLDSGLNGEIRYSILGGNEDDSFEISQDNGTIFTRRMLDRERVSTYNLIVSASDQGIQKSLSSTVQVPITLRDINDESPVFTSPNETVVMENEQLGTVVFVIKAIDGDEGRNGHVEYILHNEKATFSLGAVDGLLRVTGIIDRENKENYTLQIVAKDKGEPPKSSKQELFIRILDSNDNSPNFNPRQYSTAIPENSSVGISILQVSATDVDDGLNGNIRYSIVSGDENHDFMIGDDTGVIRLFKNLDFERKQNYELIVRAEDSGVHPLYDEVSVFITILNVNDNPPVFLNSPYIAFVRENLEGGPLSLLTVSAADADMNANQQMRYLLKDGDRGTFRINATSGEITVHQKLDREKQPEYILSVIAMDGGSPRLSGTGTVKVIVTDANDNAPVFEHTRYEVAIEGDSPPGTSVYKISASDADDGLNSKIKYFLPGTSPFFIDENSGVIKTTAEIDRQVPHVFHLIVEARDSNPVDYLQAFANLTIRVDSLRKRNFKGFKDQNSYSVTIPENSGPGTFVFGLSSENILSGIGSRYYLGGPHADKFTIDEENGVVKTTRSLKKYGGSFELEIYSNDVSAQDPLSPSIPLRIELSNSNGFPVARAPRSTFTLKENSRNLSLTKIEVMSPRTGVTFAIGGGNVGDAFELDEKTGEVRLSSIGLDYELARAYDLWILVRSSTRPFLATPILLHVDVTDENDNEPIFEKSTYNLSILEEEFGPTVVGVLTATDADSGDGGKFKYRLNPESISSYGRIFEIDPVSGELKCMTKLDREEKGEYALIVEAVDEGVPSLSGSASVRIQVLDKNDNPPRFTRLFSANVTENVPLGTFVTQVSSVDKDIGRNANSSYSFTDPGQTPFAIDPVSGNITVTGILDREVQDEYLIRVAAIDGSWRAETLVTVIVQDVNDNAPEFEQSYYSFNVPESKSAISIIGQVSATDRDKRGPNSMVSYELMSPSDFFTVDPLSGEIFTKKPLVYKMSRKNKESPENEHNLILSATDGGKPSLSSEILVSIKIADSHNTPPQFAQGRYEASVLETAKIGSRLIQVRATDKDVGLNAQLFYSFIGNNTDLFDLDKSSGWITLKSDLSGKKFQKYFLTVEVADMGIPSLTAQVPVLLTVTGPNEHTPEFSSASYRVIVPENEVVGSVIVTLTASDGDSGPNGQVSYNITSGNENEKFEIDPSSGAVSIRGELDYENQKEFSLNISATDKGFYSRKTEAQLTVLLTDINDNSPKFSKAEYRGRIFENSPFGTQFLQVTAEDKDSAKNAQIQYAIAGGSGKNLFNINATTGIISSRAILDYETRQNYNLEIVASNPDSGLFGTTRVEVEVGGVNEFVPKFLQPVFQFSVSESATLGAIVGRLEASDEDSGIDGHISYFFLGASNDKGFSINPSTGEIRVSRPLDRESQSRVVLSVIAKNAGSIRGNDIDEAQVVITVQDGNDPPIFTKDTYTAQLYEDLPLDSFVTKVEAVDIDVRPSNNRFSYEILQGNDNNTFRIDPLSGTVELAGKLDRELIDSYILTIGAVDTGEPPATGMATLSISVLDRNDNAPQLEKMLLRGSIAENEVSGTVIMKLRATDPDLSPNGEPFTYSIVGGSGAALVKLDSKSGLLSSLVSFDREKTPEITLLVQIQDNGNPPLKSTQEIIIKISDVNDNPSQSRQAKLLVYSPSPSQNPFETFATLEPLDPDFSGNYTCRFSRSSSQEIFKLQNGCSLGLQKIPEARNLNLEIFSDDGVHAEVASKFEVEFHPYEPDTLENSILIRIGGGLNPEVVLQKYFTKLLEFVQNVFNTEPGTVQIHGLLPTSSNGTDLILYVAKMEKEKVVAKLLSSANQSAMQKILQTLPILNYSPCNPGRDETNPCLNDATACSHQLEATNSRRIISSPNLILSSPEPKIKFTCTCSPEFEGPKCEYRKEPCRPNPCEGGGSCSKSGFGFQCSCPSNRHGKRCELEKSNACQSNPCKNGGSCKQETTGGSSFFCLCRPGFLGRTCQVSATNLCKPNPCQNGGECVSGPSAHPTCVCKGQFYGKLCEKSGFGFSVGSFMSFPPLDPNTNDISIVFSTNKENSLLAYNFGEQTGGRSDFLALELVNGKPRLAFGGSRTGVGSVTLNRFLADGKWHRVTAIRNSRAISLNVSQCGESGEGCEECKAGDSSCYADEVGHTGTLSFNGNPLYIGGIETIGPILRRPEQVQADDFIGCIHSLEINGRPLNMSSPLESRGIKESCQRVQNVCSPGSHKCGAYGECIDLWDSYMCRCSQFIAQNCEEALHPYTVRAGGSIDFHIGEKYRTSRLIHNVQFKYQDGKFQSQERNSNTISFSFRTTRPDGVLFFVSTHEDYTLIELHDGGVTLITKVSNNYPINMTVPNLGLVDGNWHNIKLYRSDQTLRLYIDERKEGDELNSALTHNFLDPQLTAMMLAGVRSDVLGFSSILPNFEGCFANFSINGHLQPLNGSGTLLDASFEPGSVLQGCSSALAASSAPDPLSIGVTLVIVFFTILLVAILVSFVIFRFRRAEKSPLPSPSSGGTMKLRQTPTSNHHNSSIPPSNENETTIRDFVRNVKKRGDGTIGYQKPDIIERSNPNPQVYNPPSPPMNHLRGNLVSLDPDLPELPEHYDLENASSIAPSDIDIVYHYKGYRDHGGGGSRSKSSPFSHSHHFPMSHHQCPAPGGMRQSPISNVLKSTPLARLSPSSELSQQTTPRILTLQDISGKPYQSALLSAQKDVMSQSEHSLNMSQSSARSSLINPSRNPGRKIPSRRKKSVENDSSMSIGLTAEDVERLNNSTRHNTNNSSLVSTMDVVSSSESEDAIVSRRPPLPRDTQVHRKHRGGNGRNISSEDGDSDDNEDDESFSCSEFEYTEKDRRPPLPIFSKKLLTGKDGHSEGGGSLATLVAGGSDDGLGGYHKSPIPSGLGNPLGNGECHNSNEGWNYLNKWNDPPDYPPLAMFKNVDELSSSKGHPNPSNSSSPLHHNHRANNNSNNRNDLGTPSARGSHYPPPPRPNEEYV